MQKFPTVCRVIIILQIVNFILILTLHSYAYYKLQVCLRFFSLLQIVVKNFKRDVAISQSHLRETKTRAKRAADSPKDIVLEEDENENVDDTLLNKWTVFLGHDTIIPVTSVFILTK